jgi:hypothetical protein
MMDFITRLVDPYDRQARLYPALIAIAPVAVFFTCLHSSKLNLWTSIGSVLAACGVLYLISNLARNAGKRMEEMLFEEWGGKPTTQLLRHRNSDIDEITKERYHAVLSKGIGKAFPSAAEEVANPGSADVIYQAGIRWLIEATRDPKSYAFVLKENIAYGFHRNMLGLRPVGASLSVLVMLGTLFEQGVIKLGAPVLVVGNFATLSAPALLSLLASIALLLVWVFAFRRETVRRFAFIYAERLLQACDSLARPARRVAKAKE